MEHCALNSTDELELKNYVESKVLKGDWKATLAIMQAIGDVIINLL